MKHVKRWDQLPLVEVVWVDAAMNSDHTGDLDDPSTRAKFGKLLMCSDVGYLIRKDRKELVLAVGVCREDQTYRHSNTLPMGWVKEVIYLTRPQAQP